MKMRKAALVRILIATFALFALPAAALDSIDTVELHLESNVSIDDCRENIVKALAKHSIAVTDNPGAAQAVYKIRMRAEEGGWRTHVDWAVALFSTQGEKLFTDNGQESGWSAGGACSDLAPDLAEKLEKSIRHQSLTNF